MWALFWKVSHLSSNRGDSVISSEMTNYGKPLFHLPCFRLAVKFIVIYEETPLSISKG
jgi:hypothetical protein